MKKTTIEILVLFLLLFAAESSAFAQGGPPPGGGRRGGFDPEEMVKREKQNVYKIIEDLSDDQKMLLDGIYDEFNVSFRELRDEIRKTRDFQNMRPKMEALRDEKNELIKDVLNEEQFARYMGMMEKQQKKRKENMQRRGEQRDQQNTPASEEESQGN